MWCCSSASAGLYVLLLSCWYTYVMAACMCCSHCSFPACHGTCCGVSGSIVQLCLCCLVCTHDGCMHLLLSLLIRRLSHGVYGCFCASFAASAIVFLSVHVKVGYVVYVAMPIRLCRVPEALQPFMPRNLDFIPFRKQIDPKTKKLIPSDDHTARKAQFDAFSAKQSKVSDHTPDQ